MAFANLKDLRLSLEAFWFGSWASITKPAAWRGVYWTGHLSLQSDLLSIILRVRDRDCRDQGLRIRVQWVLEEFLAGSALKDLSRIHHHEHVAHVRSEGMLAEDPP